MHEALPKLTETFQVLHLCGKGNLSEAHETTPNYVHLEYLNDEMADAYACADVVISRAGANALCELLALRKPSLLIPYPAEVSRGDQEMNAASLRKRNLARVLEQRDMTPDRLVQEVIGVYHDRGALLDAMASEATANGVENVLKQIYAAVKK